jgi:DNA-binding NarL/FixJ family response regulator
VSKESKRRSDETVIRVALMGSRGVVSKRVSESELVSRVSKLVRTCVIE